MRWQLLDWPPLASHAMFLFIGLGISGMAKTEVVKPLELARGHFLFTPDKGLLSHLSIDSLGIGEKLSLAQFDEQTAAYCRLSAGKFHVMQRLPTLLLHAKRADILALGRLHPNEKAHGTAAVLMPLEQTETMPDCIQTGVVRYD